MQKFVENYSAGSSEKYFHNLFEILSIFFQNNLKIWAKFYLRTHKIHETCFRFYHKGFMRKKWRNWNNKKKKPRKKFTCKNRKERGQRCIIDCLLQMVSMETDTIYLIFVMLMPYFYFIQHPPPQKKNKSPSSTYNSNIIFLGGEDFVSNAEGQMQPCTNAKEKIHRPHYSQ